jgi:hypothetical protein
MKIVVTGDKKLRKVFKQLPQAAQRRVLAKVVTRGAKPLVVAARRKARRMTGALAKSIKVRRPRPKYKTTRLAVVGPAYGKKAYRQQWNKRKKSVTLRAVGKKRESEYEGLMYRNPGKYGHLVEGGHGGPHPAPAYPFMEPAIREVGDVAVADMLDAAWDGIQAEVAKLRG